MNILLTCAGRRNYLLLYFKEALSGKGNVFASDTSSIAPSMQEADKAFVVPPVYSPEYIDIILSICEENQVKLLIPLNDLELPILAKARNRFQNIGTIPVVSSQQVIDICFDKWKTYLFAKEHGVGAPETFQSIDNAINAINAGKADFPLVIKPRWGTASIGIDTVSDLTELKLSCQLTKKRLPRTMLAQISATDTEKNVLIQEMMVGHEYGIDVVNDLNGNYVCAFVKHKLGMRAGETDKAETVEMSMLTKIAERIGMNLRHIGNLDCDVFVTDKGCYLLEMNPRFGGGYPFSHIAGANLPAALISWANNDVPDPKWFNFTPGIVSAKCDRLVVKRSYSNMSASKI